jgi:hypothetical protein
LLAQKSNVGKKKIQISWSWKTGKH